MSRRSGKYPSVRTGGTRTESPEDVANWCSALFSVPVELLLTNGRRTVVECRSEKFVEFLLSRRDRGYVNSFRELDVKPVTRIEAGWPIVVSTV